MSVLWKVSDLVFINILYIICCLPIVTIGAATTALYYTTLKLTEDRGSSAIKSFLKAFKDNFKQGTIIWMILLLAGLLLVADYFILNMMGGYAAIKILLGIPVLIVCITLIYVFPLLARFENTVKKTLENAFLLGIAHLPKSVVMLVISVLPFLGCVVELSIIPIILSIGFSGVAYLNSLFLVRIFKKLEPETEEEQS